MSGSIKLGAGENKVGPNPGEGEDQLAKDIARLYAWAHVEGVPYRDFSRERKLHDKEDAPADDQKVETTTNPPAAADAEVIPFKPLAADAPAVAIQPAIHSDEPRNAAAVGTAPSQVPPLDTTRLIPPKIRTRPLFVEESLSSAAEGFRPVLAVHSLAGGVGKTTLCANLARVLCSLGEKVLLVDASGSGLLPFYFGANDLRPGLRKFAAPGMAYSPLRVIGADEITAEWLNNEVIPAMQESDRIIFDLGPASFGLRSKIFAMSNAILIPVLTDLNSILSIRRIEASLEKIRASGVKVPAPFYLNSKFDNENPLDQRGRELIATLCGERLLPFTLCRSTEVIHAIASHMTVVDHAPESEVAHEYLELAAWLQTVAPARPVTKALGRWTEQ